MGPFSLDTLCFAALFFGPSLLAPHCLSGIYFGRGLSIARAVTCLFAAHTLGEGWMFLILTLLVGCRRVGASCGSARLILRLLFCFRIRSVLTYRGGKYWGHVRRIHGTGIKCS